MFIDKELNIDDFLHTKTCPFSGAVYHVYMVTEGNITYLVKEFPTSNEVWLDDNGHEIPHVTTHKEWFLDGKLHRENGPAITWANGDQEWYLNGEEVGGEEE